jgi:Zn-dependent peptidase ImmA (M78 family)
VTITSSIEAQAEKLLHDAGLEDEIPVPLEKVASYLGYECLGFTPEPSNEEISGAIDYRGKKIYVNTNETLNRQRFTIAHEIGHAVLHGIGDDPEGMVDLRLSIDNPSTSKEVEANKFAAALLMPAKRFITEVSRWNNDTQMLTTIFGASTASVKLRLKNVKC